MRERERKRDSVIRKPETGEKSLEDSTKHQNHYFSTRAWISVVPKTTTASINYFL
jgi:hypothetical protein